MLRRKLPPRVFLGLLFLLLPAALQAQQSMRAAFDADVDAGLEDARRVFTAPAHFDGGDWLYAALAAGLTAAAYTVDGDVRDYAQRQPVEDWELPLTVGQWYGSGAVSGALGAGLYAAGLIAGDDDTRITGRLVLQSMAYSLVITELLKVLTGRARPYLGEGKDAFGLPTLDIEHHSFPSGHATVAFALSATLARRFGSTPLSVLLYGLAAMTAVQRVADDRHWLSDTVLGAVIGGVVGLAVVRFEEERETGVTISAPLQFDSGQGEVFGRHRPLLEWKVAF